MEGLGLILSVDNNNARKIDDAFSINFDDDGNYILDIYIADPISINEQKAFELIKENINRNKSNQTISLKRFFSNCSLSEREEKDSFDFRFVISKNGDIISFGVTEKKVLIDIEMTHDDVVDTIEEDSYLADYLAIAYSLGEKIAKKNTSKVCFDDNFEEMSFPFPFPKEFLKLLNITLLEKCTDFNLPLIYFDFSRDESNPSCFTSVRPVNCDLYARFNSPLRCMDCLYNLMVFYEFIYCNRINDTNLIKEYSKISDGYIDLVKSYVDFNEVKK